MLCYLLHSDLAPWGPWQIGQNGGCEFEGVMDRNNTNSMRELVADSVISILGTIAADGKTYKTQYYNLDAIIAVDYRQPVNS